MKEYVLRKSIHNREMHKFAQWMVKHFGAPEEGKTWFWNSGDVTAENKIIDSGVTIWNGDPKKITMMQLMWS